MAKVRSFKKPCSMQQLAKLLPTNEGVPGIQQWVDTFRAPLFELQHIEVTGFGYFTLDRWDITFKAKLAFYEEIKTGKRSHPRRDDVVGAIARAFREGYDAVTLEGIGSFFALPRPEGDGVFVKLAVDETFKGKTVADLEHVLFTGENEDLAYAGARLKNLGSQSTVDRLVEMLRNKRDPAGRKRAALALAYIAPLSASAIPDLIAVLGDNSAELRADAALALGDNGKQSAPAVDALAKLLADPDSTCRSRAAYALGQIGPKAAAALKPLAALYAREKDSLIREAVIEALGALKSDAALPTIAKALTDKDEEVRTRALQALRGRKAPSATKVLQKLIETNEAEIKKVIKNFGGRDNLDELGDEIVQNLTLQNKLARKALPKDVR